MMSEGQTFKKLCTQYSKEQHGRIEYNLIYAVNNCTLNQRMGWTSQIRKNILFHPVLCGIKKYGDQRE